MQGASEGMQLLKVLTRLALCIKTTHGLSALQSRHAPVLHATCLCLLSVDCSKNRPKHAFTQYAYVVHSLSGCGAAAAAGVKGRTISLKLKRRKTNAPDPPKFMGHGDCDNMSRSITLSCFTDAAAELGTQGKALLKALRVDPTQIRGIGLNVS